MPLRLLFDFVQIFFLFSHLFLLSFDKEIFTLMLMKYLSFLFEFKLNSLGVILLKLMFLLVKFSLSLFFEKSFLSKRNCCVK